MFLITPPPSTSCKSRPEAQISPGQHKDEAQLQCKLPQHAGDVAVDHNPICLFKGSGPYYTPCSLCIEVELTFYSVTQFVVLLFLALIFRCSHRLTTKLPPRHHQCALPVLTEVKHLDGPMFLTLAHCCK
jgi:hypothetical protein